LEFRAISESDLLPVQKIALESEAYWGFSEEHMIGFKEKYGVSLELINSCIGYVLIKDENIIGFYMIVDRSEYMELELCYVNKKEIGNGYGRIIWSHMEKTCRSSKIEKIILICSDVVKGYYERMGAKIVEKKESIIDKGIIVNKMEYLIK
jgi:hypothetical protein